MERRVQAERERRYDLMRMPFEEGIQNQPKKKTEIKCGACQVSDSRFGRLLSKY